MVYSQQAVRTGRPSAGALFLSEEIAMKNQRIPSRCVGGAMLLAFLLLSASAFGYEKEIKDLSAAMAEKIAGKGKQTVAVVDFNDLEGNITQLDRFIAEEFSVALAGAGKGFKVIDRTHLKAIIKENNLSATGLIDPATIKKLGKIVGVDALITGTLTPFGDNMHLAVKILDTETAEIIDATTGDIAKTKAIDEMLGKEIESASSENGETKKAEAKPAQAKDAKGDSGPFSDNFDNGPKPDWKPINGNWTMSNGQYTVTDINPREMYSTFIDGKRWGNFTMEIDVTPGDTANGFHSMNICPRMISSQEKICFGMYGKNRRFNEAYWFIAKDGTNGEPTSSVSIENSDGKPLHIKIEVKNGVFTSYVNSTQTNQISDNTFPLGSIGLSQWYKYWDGNKIRITFDNLEIKPLKD